MSQLRAALVSFAFLTLVTGGVYPFVITELAILLFPHEARGSLIVRDGKVVGSSLIGQSFDEPKYFWGRVSATTPPYNASASSGSNSGPLNQTLTAEVQGRLAALHAADPENTAPVPVDLVTSSGSGLDPDISPAAAQYQAHRVAVARQLDEAQVRQLIAEHTKDRQLMVLGEPHVNVLELNLALDAAVKK